MHCYKHMNMIWHNFLRNKSNAFIFGYFFVENF